MAKIGLIQVRGMGDCVIILPIAHQFQRMGHDVYIALDERYCDQFQYAAPYCTFVPVPGDGFDPDKGLMNELWYERPRRLLEARGCDEIISFPLHECIFLNQNPQLHSVLGHRLSGTFEKHAFKTQVYKHLKFDEFKYYVAQMPLKLKWSLGLRRNAVRERALYDKLIDPTKKHVVCHLEGSDGFSIDASTMQVNTDKFQMIQITSDVTDNVFDWLMILETAHQVVLLDSVFFNLVEQLNFSHPVKTFIRRSPTKFTPVIGNQWRFIDVDVPDQPMVFA